MFRQHVPTFQASEDKYDDMNITGLKSRASKLRIPLYSKFKNTAKGRSDLAKLIREAEAGTTAKKPAATPAKAVVNGSAEDWLTYCQRRPEMCSLAGASGLAVGLGGYYVLTLLQQAAVSAATSALYAGVTTLLAVGAGTAGVQAFRHRNTIWIRRYNQSKTFAKMELHELQVEVERLKTIQCKWYTLNLSQKECDENKELLDVASETLSTLNKKKDEMKAEVEEVLRGARRMLGNKYDKVFNGTESTLPDAWSNLSRPKQRKLSEILTLIHEEILASLDSEQAKQEEKRQHSEDVPAIQRIAWKQINDRQKAKLAGAISRRVIDTNRPLRLKAIWTSHYNEYQRIQKEIKAVKAAEFQKNEKRINTAFDQKNKDIYQVKDSKGKLRKAKDLTRYEDDPADKMSVIERKENEWRASHVMLVSKWAKVYQALAKYIRDNQSTFPRATLTIIERLFDSDRRPPLRLINAKEAEAVEVMLTIPRGEAEAGIAAINAQLKRLGILEEDIEDIEVDGEKAIELNNKLVDLVTRLQQKAEESEHPKKYIAALAVLENNLDQDIVEAIADLDLKMSIQQIASILAPEVKASSSKSAAKKKKSKVRSTRNRQ